MFKCCKYINFFTKGQRGLLVNLKFFIYLYCNKNKTPCLKKKQNMH